MMTAAPGVRLGPYELIAAIGAGGMGQVLQQDQWQQAIEILDQALRLNPNHALARNAQGFSSSRFRRSNFTHAIRINPNYANAYLNRGVARRMIGDTEGSAEDQKKSDALTR